MLIKKLFINLENVKIVSKNLQNSNFIKYKFNEFVSTFDKTENISVVGEKIKIYQKYLNEKISMNGWIPNCKPKPPMGKIDGVTVFLHGGCLIIH